MTVASMVSALCVVILSLGSLIESLDLSLSVIAGLFVMIVATEYGDRVGFAVFLVSGLISLMLPIKSPGIFYLAILGWYPLVQKKIHQLPPFISRVVKLLLFNGISAALIALSVFVLMMPFSFNTVFIITLVLANACFVLYDTLLERFLIWYIVKIRKRLGF